MQIIDTVPRNVNGHPMHRIAVEFADGRKASAVIFQEPERETVISLVAACKIAGVSEEAYRHYIRTCDLETPYITVPAEINGTLQARKMVFTAASDMAYFLENAGAAYSDMRAWFAALATSSGGIVIGFNGAMNPVEAKRAGIRLEQSKEPVPPAPVTPVNIDFDATGGIEQLNHVISSLEVPYQVRARALSIQNDFSQLAKVIETLNTTGKAA